MNVLNMSALAYAAKKWANSCYYQVDSQAINYFGILASMC